MQPYQSLEAEFAAWSKLNPEGMVACSSGTAALHLALESMELDSGNTVIVPDFTMVSCARAVTMADLKPWFWDCRRADLCLDLEPADGFPKNRFIAAIMAVHVYGRVVDMAGLMASKASFHKVVEDLSEAHGVPPHPKTDAACWSFYRNKIVHGEEGGMVYFKNPSHAAVARELRSCGFLPGQDYSHRPRGHNYRLANALADLVRANLTRYDEEVAARKETVAVYEDWCPKAWRQPARVVPWVYDFRVPGMTRAQQDAVVKALKASGLEARHAFKPMSSQLEYAHPRADMAWQCPEAALASREVVYLPVAPAVTDFQASRAFRDVQTALNSVQ